MQAWGFPSRDRKAAGLLRRPSFKSGSAGDQLLRSLSTSLFFEIHGILARSLAPTSSIGCWASLARLALNEVWLNLFSSIQLRVNRPAWISPRPRFIPA